MNKSSLLFLSIFLFANVQAQEKTLDYYLSYGIQNSPLLKDYANLIKSNAIDKLRTAASYKTQINAASTNTYAPVTGGYGYEGAITNVGNFSELITVQKQLIGKANLQNQFENIHLLSDSLQLASKISERDLSRTITAQYITAYGSWQQYQFNMEVYDLLSKEDTILKKLAQAAVYRQTDYLTFFVTLQQQKISVTQARNQFQNDFGTLNYVCGLFDTSFTALANPRLNATNLLTAGNTVFFEKYRTDSLLLINAEAQIDFNYRPKVSLYADAGYVSTLAYKAYKNFGISFGVFVNAPIYDGGQRKMQHTKIAIAGQTLQEYRNFFLSQYNQQTALLMQQLQSTQRLIDETNNQLKYVEGLIQANKKLLATGDVHIADFIIAINNYLSAKNIITQNTINKLQLIAQINYWNNR